jgi:hypothetical protein
LSKGLPRRWDFCEVRLKWSSEVPKTAQTIHQRHPWWRKMLKVRTGSKQRRIGFKTQAKSDGLQLLRAIDATQAHGHEGVRVDPTRAAHEAGLDVGDVGSNRYHHALGYLVEEGALLGDEHTATQTGDRQAHGYALYFFTQRALKLLEG